MNEEQPISDWKIFQGNGNSHNEITRLPEPPNWRRFGYTRNQQNIPFVDINWDEQINDQRGATFRIPKAETDQDRETDLVIMVNAALYLRRPLLITGKPGTGKTSLAYAVAYELKLGPVLLWPITARSTLQEGLYRYDAIARLQDVQAQQLHRQTPNSNSPAANEKDSEDIGKYIQLGPVGTALLPYKRPRVLLIDEIDKSDINLPNDLLNLFEEGEYEIPELSRAAQVEVNVRTFDRNTAMIQEGRIRCYQFPLIVLTSNGERDFPPPFLRRCLRITMQEPKEKALTEIVREHLKDAPLDKVESLVNQFIKKRQKGDLAPDQLLNVVYLLTRNFNLQEKDQKQLIDQLLKYLDSGEDA